MDSDVEEGLFVEVTGVIQVDALVIVDPDCKDNAVGVVGRKWWSREFQFALNSRSASVKIRKNAGIDSPWRWVSVGPITGLCYLPSPRGIHH